MDLHKYPLDTQHCPLMIGSCKFQIFKQTSILLLGLTRLYETETSLRKTVKLPRSWRRPVREL